MIFGNNNGPGGFVRPREQQNQSTPPGERRMELQGALLGGGSAQAKFVLWDATSSSYKAQGTAITVYSFKNAGGGSGNWLDFVYRPDSQRWEAIEAGGGCWIGILRGTLAYASSCNVDLYKYNSGGTDFIFDRSDTCQPWMMNAGDTVATNTEVVGGVIDGVRVVFNAACKNIYGS